MRIVFRSLGLAGLAVVSAVGGAAAGELTGTASVVIRQVIGITEQTALDFGEVAADGSGGTVTLDPAGAVTGPSGYALSGTPAAGRFSVDGDPSTAVSISIAPGVLGGPGTMTIDNFSHDAGGTPSLDADGKLVFNVGADLEVAPDQPPGAYSGSYTVTVNY